MIEIAKEQSGERTMTIKPIPERNCQSVRDFFNRGGEVEIPRPAECLYAQCLLKRPLRKNGSYLRQVVYWGLAFLVYVYRFRCSRCGKTISCPYSWLVPYCRFTAEVIAAGIERYADSNVSYRDVSTELSEMEFADPAIDIRETETYKKLVEETEKQAACGMESSTNSKIKQVGRFLGVPKKKASPNKGGQEKQHPVHTTVFSWVEFLCKHAEWLLTQTQKELVQEWKRNKRELRLPAASAVENPNSKKACSATKIKLLDQVSLVSLGAKVLVSQSNKSWQRLRAYFLTKAELCKDILTNTIVVLTSTQTFELDLF
jgi:hypothetical protein